MKYNQRMQIVLYGAGKYGAVIYDYFKEKGIDISCFCDSDEKLHGTYLKDKRIFSLNNVKAKFNNPIFIVTVYNNEKTNAITEKLKIENCNVVSLSKFVESTVYEMNEVDVLRDICARFHISCMDKYFELAENDESLLVFWSKDSSFFKLFSQLDLTNVVELACGRGRHVPQYLNQTSNVMLVDILEKNIEFCKERFDGIDKISYYCNNGYDLYELSPESYTSLFTYDAMVHFELIDVYKYLLETFRILKKGGKALFHHSNYDKDYKCSFTNSINGRNFMNKQIFAHLSNRAGFEIIEQKIINWGAENLDCITLVKKI